MKLQHLLILFILIQSQIGNSQERIDFLTIEKDSLASKTDSEKAFYLKDKSIEIGHPDSAYQMASLSIEFAKKCDCSNLLMACYYTTAFHSYYKGDYPVALENQLLADSICLVNNTLNFAFQSKTLLATIYNVMGNSDNALANYKKALFIAKKEKDSIRIGDAYNNIGEVYVRFEENEMAIKYKLKAVKMYGNQTKFLLQLSNVYGSLSNLIEKEEEAKTYLDMAYKYTLELDNPYFYALYLANEGYFYNRFKKIKKAERAYLESYNLSQKNYYPDLISMTSSELGKIYNEMNMPDKAIHFLEIYAAIDKGLIENKAANLSIMAEIYASKEKFKKAYYYAFEANKLSDSLKTIQNNELLLQYDNTIENLERDEKITKQNARIAEQELLISKEKNISYQVGIVATLGLALFLFVFQRYYYRQKKKKQMVENQLKKEQELNELRTTFLENIAHEIRTPITLLNGHLDLALEKTKSADLQKEHIEFAKTNSKKILANANEILELLKLEKGELPLKEEEILAESFFKRVFYAFESLAELKQIDLVYSSAISKGLRFYSDQNRLEKIVGNYISNAIKFSPSKSTVRFFIEQIKNNLVISVQDEGPGIATDEQTKIFTRFYQSKSTDSVGGVGVGLSIAKEYAASLGGTVSVKNNAEKGTKFSVSLPVVICETKQNQEKQKRATPLNVDKEIQLNLMNNPTILIVEDNPEMNAYLVTILSNTYNCETAFDGMEAIQKIQTHHYSLIISDVMMPEMDGMELKKKINALQNYKTVPFIFITAKAQMTDRLLAYDLGVDDYIIKPFVHQELLSRIANLLANKQQREHWLKDNIEFVDNKGSSDEKLLEKIKQIILKNIDDVGFKVSNLAAEVGYSPRQLTRVVNKMVGLSPVQYILEIRLKKAHLYLIDKKYATIAETRNSVGIASASYFNKKFWERFGVKPSEI